MKFVIATLAFVALRYAAEALVAPKWMFFAGWVCGVAAMAVYVASEDGP